MTPEVLGGTKNWEVQLTCYNLRLQIRRVFSHFDGISPLQICLRIPPRSSRRVNKKLFSWTINGLHWFERGTGPRIVIKFRKGRAVRSFLPLLIVGFFPSYNLLQCSHHIVRSYLLVPIWQGGVCISVRANLQLSIDWAADQVGVSCARSRSLVHLGSAGASYCRCVRSAEKATFTNMLGMPSTASELHGSAWMDPPLLTIISFRSVLRAGPRENST